MALIEIAKVSDITHAGPMEMRGHGELWRLTVGSNEAFAVLSHLRVEDKQQLRAEDPEFNILDDILRVVGPMAGVELPPAEAEEVAIYPSREDGDLLGRPIIEEWGDGAYDRALERLKHLRFGRHWQMSTTEKTN